MAAFFLLLMASAANSQELAPKGFVKGRIKLADNSEVSGYIKENIRNKASIILQLDSGGKKIALDGDKLASVSFDAEKYICIKGDFFKVLCEGELYFLQKSSDASSKPVYVGAEAMFINGTEGKPGDYFLYNQGLQQLKLVNNKNVTAVTAQSFVNCEAAIAKAKEAAADVAVLKDAVIIFNNRNR